MREIKFRAWDNSTKKMYYTSGLTVCNNSVIHMDGHIMQFTGLKDRNGRDIYEGDYILVEQCECIGHNNDGQDQWTDCKGEVLFEDGMFVFSGHSAGNIPLYAYDVEIIGNVYEHPEFTI